MHGDELRCRHGAEEGKDQGHDHAQEQAVLSAEIGFPKVFRSQVAAQKGVHAHADADGKGGNEHLQWKGHAHRGQGFFAHPRHPDTVHDIVQALNEHGQGNGQGYAH